MSEAWGRLIYRRRRLALVIAAIGIVFAGAWGKPAPVPASAQVMG